MLSVLGAYLWKEWRDQRAGIAALAAIVVVLAGAAAWLMQEISDPIVSKFTLGALVAALVLFTPDIAASDLRRGTHGLVFRAPGGVHAAFWSKVALLVSVLAAFAVLGYAAIRAAHAVRGAMAWAEISMPWHATTGLVVLHALAAAFWIFAAACWLPRGWIGVPGAALFVMLGIAPCVWLLHGKTLLVAYLPLGWLHLAHPALAFAVAWVSFVRGRRAGGTAWSSAWRGMSVAMCGFAGLWAFVGYQVHEWWTPRPAESVLICSGYLGTGGRHAFLNTQREEDWPSIGLMVELETGAWRATGTPGELFVEPGVLDGHSGFNFGRHELLCQTEGWKEIAYIDGAHGTVLGRGPFERPYVDLIERARTAKRAGSPIRLPDGRRAWLLGRRLEADDGRGGFVELPWDVRDRMLWPVGYGLRISARKGWVVYDLTRQRRFDAPKFEFDTCWVLEDHWLICEVGRHSWRLFDPETRRETPAPGMRDGDQVLAVLDDGRVLVCNRKDPDAMFAVRPHVGERVELTFDGFALPACWYLHDAGSLPGTRAPARAPDGRRLFILSADGDKLLTTLAPGATSFTRPWRIDSVLGCLDARTAVVIREDRRALERLDLLTGARKTLFPRP